MANKRAAEMGTEDEGGDTPVILSVPSDEYRRKLITDAKNKAAMNRKDETEVGGIYAVPGDDSRFVNANGEPVDNEGNPVKNPANEPEGGNLRGQREEDVDMREVDRDFE